MSKFEDDFIQHHGVKGMHWGIRKDYRRYVNKTKRAADDIFRTISPKEREILGMNPDDKEWLSSQDAPSVSKRVLIRSNDGKPRTVLDVYGDKDSRQAAIAVMTRNDNESRGKGYATQAMREATKWFDKSGKTDFDRLVYWVRADNKPSVNLAIRSGFNLDHDEKETEDIVWSMYTYDRGIRHMSKFENDILRTMGSSKFEQDFIEHHGIKGQKWGVRRYQNKDGTLTSAGQKRYDKLETKRSSTKAKASKALDRDIHSFDPYTRTGMKTLGGKTVLTAKDVRDSQAGLRAEKARRMNKIDAKYDKKVARVTGDYSKVHNRAMNDAESAYRKKNGSYKNSATTKRVKNDYRNLSDSDFMQKYQTSKKTYAKRVSKYGDPYTNSPLAKTGKKIEKASRQKENRKVEAIMNKYGITREQATLVRNHRKKRNIEVGLKGAVALSRTADVISAAHQARRR